jgi:hypothetical protein
MILSNTFLNHCNSFFFGHSMSLILTNRRYCKQLLLNDQTKMNLLTVVSLFIFHLFRNHTLGQKSPQDALYLDNFFYLRLIQSRQVLFVVIFEKSFRFPNIPSFHLESDQKQSTVVSVDFYVFVKIKSEELVPS